MSRRNTLFTEMHSKYESRVIWCSHIFTTNDCNRRGRRELPTHFSWAFHIDSAERAQAKGRRIKCLLIFNFDKAEFHIFLASGRRPRRAHNEMWGPARLWFQLHAAARARGRGELFSSLSPRYARRLWTKSNQQRTAIFASHRRGPRSVGVSEEASLFSWLT